MDSQVRTPLAAALRTVAVVAAAFALVATNLPVTGGAASASQPAPVDVVTETVDGLPEAAKQPTGDVVVSAVVETPIPFAMVGFDIPPGAQVEFRTSADGATFDPWGDAPSYAQEGDARDPVEGGPSWASKTEPTWVGERNHLQLRVRGASPDDVETYLLDVTGQSAQEAPLASRGLHQIRRRIAAATAPAVAEASTARPNIVSRASWGAGPSRDPRYHAGVRAATLHHTAGANSYTCAQAPGVVKGIWDYHAKTLGWGDIGYHFVVDKCGTVYEGRAGGVDRPVLGAHAGGFNTATFGVAILGTYETAPPSAAAVEAINRVVAWKFSLSKVNPSGQVTLTSGGSTKYKSGTNVTLPTFFGHRQVSATACPGNALYNHMPAMRKRIAALMAAPAPAPTAAPAPAPATVPNRVGGQLVRRSDGAEFYLSGGRAHHLPDWSVRASYGWRPEHLAAEKPGQLAAMTRATMWWRPGTLLRTPDGRLWLWDGSTRRGMTRTVFAERGYASAAVLDISAKATRATPTGSALGRTGYVAGEVVRFASDPQRFEVARSSGRLVLRPVSAKVATSRYGALGQAARRPTSGRPPVGNPVGFRPGNVLAAGDGKLWFVSSAGERRRASSSTLAAYGMSRVPRTSVTAAELSRHARGAPLR